MAGIGAGDRNADVLSFDVDKDGQDGL
jgi:hypothetical protein